MGLFGLAALREKESGITYEIRSEIDVLDVRTQLDDLAITFQGEEIGGKGLKLRIISIRVVNTGNVDILQSHYDQLEPWGLSLSSGKIIETRGVEGSSDYLQRQATPVTNGQDVIELPKVILDKQTFFAF